MRSVLASVIAILCLLGAGAQAQTELADIFREDIEALRLEAGVDGVGVAIVAGDNVILAEGFGMGSGGQPLASDSLCGLFSATKALTAFTLVGVVEAEIINLDDTIGHIWPEAPQHWAEIPLWRLYNHTSGIPMIVNQPVFESLASDPLAGNAEIVSYLFDQPLEYEPGEFSRYRQSGYALAEWLISEMTQVSWPELVRRHLSDPAGAQQTRHSQLASGERSVPLLTSAGFYETTPEDMAAIFLALNAEASIENEALIDLLLDPQYVHGNYGLGLIHESVEGVPTIGHRGGGARANIRYAPQAGYGVFACTEQQNNNELTIRIADTIMRALVTGVTPD